MFIRGEYLLSSSVAAVTFVAKPVLRRAGGWALAAAALAALLYVSRGQSLPAPEEIREFLDRYRRDAEWAPYLPSLYTALVAFFAASTFPRSVVILAATAVFGGVYATLYTSVGGTLGAGAAFLIARYLAQDFIQSRLPAGWRKWEEQLSRNGFVTMAAFRSIPFSPMSTPHYAAGLSRMSFPAFLAGSFLGFVVSTVFYVFFSGAVIALYKKFFAFPHALSIIIGIQSALLAAGYLFYRRQRRKEGKIHPVVAPPPGE